MKTIGLLGGMSPESTIDYYRLINAGVRRARGGHHGARMLIYSVDLDPVVGWIEAGDDRALAAHLAGAAATLEGGGADFVVMACNTTHRVAAEIEAALAVPFVHIADVLGEALREAGLRRVGLLGTRYTMEDDLYRRRLRDGFGVEVVTPGEAARAALDRVIFEELCFHDVRPGARRLLSELAAELAARGTEALVLGCTELGLLVDTPTVAGLEVFDTTRLHCERAVDLVLDRAALPRPAHRAA